MPVDVLLGSSPMGLWVLQTVHNDEEKRLPMDGWQNTRGLQCLMCLWTIPAEPFQADVSTMAPKFKEPCLEEWIQES